MSKSNAVKEGKYFIDYLHLSIRWIPEVLSSLSLNQKLRFVEKLNELVLQPSKDHLEENPFCKPYKYVGLSSMFDRKICKNCRRSIYRPLNVHLSVKGSMYIGRSKNHTISIHFKGGWFKTNEWKQDINSLNKNVQLTTGFIRQVMRMNGLPDRLELKVSRIDIAKNFYNGEIYDPDKQTFHNKAIKDKNYFYWNDRITSINIGRKDTPHLYFRSYDKRFQTEKSKAKAKIRFNTDQFCRNEWSLFSHKLRALKLKPWKNWVEMVEKPSVFNQLLVHLRKNRDVTYFPNKKHQYNLIHLEKGFKVFKKPAKFTKYESIPWTPGPLTIGTLEKHSDEYTFQDLHKILEIISKNTEMIPNSIMLNLKEHWMDKGMVPKNYNYYLKKGWIKSE